MVSITLTNKNPHSQDRHVVINIATGLCTFADKREIELKHLISESDFSHPLLTEPFRQTSNHIFQYQYDNLDGLLYSAIYVYSTLLHADKPLSCRFKINPSPAFQPTKFSHHIGLSIHSHKCAQETIQIGQLELIISQIMGYKFKFAEDYIIDTQFTIKDLPSSVDGDALYNTDVKLVELLKFPNDLSRYELRYISPRIGFGVFSKETIKKGDIISFYCGVKTHQASSEKNYAFGFNFDGLNIGLDARQHGNIARFINHAPSLDKSKVTTCKSKVPLLAANIEAVHHYLNGLLMVAYTATEAISAGEQLLVDYGGQFFKNSPMFRFTTNGKLIVMNKKFCRSHSRRKLNHLKIMANHGVKKAQIYLAIRLGIIVITLICFHTLCIFY